MSRTPLVMSKIRNIVYCIVVLLTMFSVIIVFAASIVVPGMKLPEKSQLEGKSYVKPTSLVKKDFLNGEFQEGAETLFSQYVPCRENVLLGFSGLQRVGIRTAAIPFGYGVVPTFYGSDRAEDFDNGVIVQSVYAEPESTDSHEALCKALNESARKHPDIRYVYDVVCGPSQTTQNPTYGLLSGRLDEDWILEHCVNPLDESISAFVDPVFDSSLEEPVFPNDAHWTLRRALESYEKLAGILSLRHVDWDSGGEVQVVDTWYGTQARFGRDFNVASDLVDLDSDFSNLTYTSLNGKEGISKYKRGIREDVLAGSHAYSNSPEMKYDAYCSYYGDGMAIIDNSEKGNGKTLLLVGDSYTYCLKRYLADNYSRTVYVLPGNYTVKQSLEHYIDEFDVDDVIVLMQSQKCEQLVELSPKFLNL